MTAAMYLLLLVALVCANLPFVTQRWFGLKRLPEKPNRKVKQMWNKLNPYWKDILIALALYLPLTVYTLCWPPSIGLLTLPFLEDVALAIVN